MRTTKSKSNYGDTTVMLDARGSIWLERTAIENGVSHLDQSSFTPGLYKVLLRERGLSTCFSVAR